jgi:hypothetical protein
MEDGQNPLRRWFEPEELSICPGCGGQTLIPKAADQDVEVCLECGPLIAEHHADPS